MLIPYQGSSLSRAEQSTQAGAPGVELSPFSMEMGQKMNVAEN